MLYIHVSVRTADRFLQEFESPNLREKQLPLQLCIPASMCKKECQIQTSPFGKHCPCLYLSSFLCFLYFSTFLFLLPPPLFCCVCLASSVSQMLPSSTSSTARRPKTLRSCVRLVPMSSQCVRTLPRPLLPRLLQPGDLFLLYHLCGTPTPCPTQAPSPVFKVCLSLSPVRAKAGLPPRAYPYLSRSPPCCGGSCLVSGTVLSLKSSQRIRGDYKR